MMNEKSAIRVLAPGLVQLAALRIEESVTGAASRAGTSQPTMSRAIRRWEDALDVTIVEEDGRGVRLTDEGRALADAAASAVDSMDMAIRRVTGADAGTRLTIAFLRSLGPSVVCELVPAYLRDHPTTSVAHREMSTSAVLRDIETGDVDVAVTAPRPPRRFRWLRLGKQAFVLLVPPSHRLAGRESASLAEVADEGFIVLDGRYHSRQVVENLWAAARIVPRIVVEADDRLTVANYVAGGLGVGVVPADSIAHAHAVSIPLTDKGAVRDFGLVWSAAGDRAAVDSFVQHAEDLCARYPGWADIEG
ncbi:LysR family transcriptional regulator [Gordonia sp. NPDC003424]